MTNEHDDRKGHNPEDDKRESDHEAEKVNKESAQNQDDNVVDGEAEVISSEKASAEEKNWAMMSHIACFAALIPLIPLIGMVLGPLFVWLFKKEEMPLVAQNGLAALNFNITMFIAYCVAFILCFILIGIPLLFGLVIFHFIVTILAAIKASEGGVYEYPFSIKLVR
ncbi:DUF4870 domain-containing protein [Kangiella sediminilitoris]|uniref:Orotate phosphoribosyltransferase n=1 Tax=Kangiella sediminilitoris TaxID=1144748 RepID=A0A1B3B7N4_9GAMM|nr:DUF4870 domain-containing protein [Kangiella sediminilitoris]AOE48799.1 hypothetical protein KS2013_67 [Kangiella sediminilitoris]